MGAGLPVPLPDYLSSDWADHEDYLGSSGQYLSLPESLAQAFRGPYDSMHDT